MEIVEPSVRIETELSEEKIYRFIETCGRTAYKSEYNIKEKSAKLFIKMLLKNGHESVLEHFNVTVRFVCDRGVSHELVRHRLASYTQESTRYVDYNKGLQVIEPLCFKDDLAAKLRWKNHVLSAEKVYKDLRESRYTPQEARCVLPSMCLKTEIVATMNLREWRHVLKLRTSIEAHPHIRHLMCMLLEDFKKELPVIFEDMGV